MMPPAVPVRIAGTGTVPAGRLVSTAELAARLDSPLDVAAIEAKTGIASRYFAEPGDTAADLTARALAAALARAGIPAEALERLIFVSSLGGDALIPATSNKVAAALGLHGSCDCFDLNNACMGFLSALDVGARSIATGRGPLAIVVAELGSRFIVPDDPRPYLVVGDGVAAAVLEQSRADEGILASWLRNDGTLAGDVELRHPGLTGQRETTRFTSSNKHITELAIEGFRRGVDAVLEQAGIALRDVEWIVLHQPNGSLLRVVTEALGLDPSRMLNVVRGLGSVGAASIPIGLDRLLRSGRVRAGDRILMAGVGGGASYGAMLVRVGQ
jgi:3-oxoacyl-(acyl-carrier-protein) synthase III